MPADENRPPDDAVVVVDLDFPHQSAGAGDPAAASERDSANRRTRTIGIALTGIGLFAVGAFVGHTNASTAADGEIRVFAGDLTVGVVSLSDGDATWEGSLPVMNDGTVPVDVVGLELPGFDVTMNTEAVTVPPSERSTVELTVTGQCATESDPVHEAASLGITLVAGGANHTVDTAAGVAPEGAAAMVRNSCLPDVRSRGFDLVVPNDSTMSQGEVSGRIGISTHASEHAEVIDVNSRIPGITIDAPDLQGALDTSRTFVEVVWSISECESATDPPGDPRVEATVRSHSHDGTVTDTAVTGTVPAEVAFHLGAMAASRCS